MWSFGFSLVSSLAASFAVSPFPPLNIHAFITPIKALAFSVLKIVKKKNWEALIEFRVKLEKAANQRLEIFSRCDY